MALTVNDLVIGSIGNINQARFKLAFDSSYPTGGEPLSSAQIGLWRAQYFQVVSNEGGYAFDYDYTTGKLKVLDVAGGGLTGSIAAASGGTPAGTLDSVTGGTPAGTLDSVTGGTPSGTNDSVSGGTPAGTLDSISGGTPAGTLDSISAGTPAGTVAAPVFTGSALGTHTHTPTAGTSNASDIWLTVQAFDASDSENADSTDSTSDVIVTADTFTNFAGTMTNPQSVFLYQGRNVIIVIKNTTGGALDLFEGVTTFTITGTYRGGAQSDTITFTSNAGNKSIAAGQDRWKRGTKAFDTISSITYDNAPAGALTGEAGPGDRFALLNDLKTPAVGDVLRVLIDGGSQAPSAVDTSAMTVSMGSSGSTFNIQYKIAGGTPTISSDTAGTPAGTNDAPVFTGAALAGHDHTFTGAALAGHDHTFTGAALAGHDHTFTGAALAGHDHTFTGAALAGHDHTFSGSALGTHTHTATLSGTTTFTEVTNGTDLSALTSVECLVIGY